MRIEILDYAYMFHVPQYDPSNREPCTVNLVPFSLQIYITPHYDAANLEP